MPALLPRRNRLDQMTPAERAIYDAAQDVELLPADERLTKAVVLLGEARDLVSDYVDDTQPPADAPATEDQ